jgi:NAD(P)-dependent dehydrogenase (short-subunit alcohol dehydrogenase family)
MTDQQKCAFVTGGAQGIGKGTAERLLRDGWAVTIADIDEEAGEETPEEFRGLGPLLSVPTDAGDEGQLHRAITETVARFGGIDLVVNNAYAAAPWMPISHITLDIWNRVLAVNLTGIMVTSKYAVPSLRERRGAIVNISSILALRTHPNVAAYGASKGAMIALTHALALSLAPEIRVNCISPGTVDTIPWRKGRRRDRPGYAPDRQRAHPVGRVGDPPDIAALVAFLASDGASFITGQHFVADGGIILKMNDPAGDSYL